MKIKFNSDDDLLLNKMLELHNMIILVQAVFHYKNNYHPQGFLDDAIL